MTTQPSLTPAAFAAKWQGVTTTNFTYAPSTRVAAHSRAADLTDSEILERLLALSLEGAGYTDPGAGATK